MSTIDEIRSVVQAKRREGDYAVVASMAGLKPDTVSRIVGGSRHNDAVLQLFATYLEKREELEQQLALEAK